MVHFCEVGREGSSEEESKDERMFFVRKAPDSADGGRVLGKHHGGRPM